MISSATEAILFLGILLSSAAAPAQEAAPTAAFGDAAATTGLDFVHHNGMSGQLHTAEIVGPGVALFDYDNDGDLDLYLGQGGSIGDRTIEVERANTAAKGTSRRLHRLFRNDLVGGDPSSLRFTDVTSRAGLGADGYNMGVATGDFDNDGWVDLYVTNLGPNHLLRNRGDGTFEDRTKQARADDRRWSVPAVFFDYDADGWLDLFVGNYHRFRPGAGKPCFLANGEPDYCGPLSYPAEEDRLLHNRADGTFEDRTIAAGMAGNPATALGAIAADFDLDGRVDLYVANDLAANHLWLNRGDGTFVEDAVLRGAAHDRNGKAQASMGVVASDLDGDGAVDLFLSHLLREYNTVYLNDGQGMFRDQSRESGVVQASWPMTGFGAVVLDYDGDGIDDLFVANGAVHRIEAQIAAGSAHPLAMENQLYRGLGGGRFEQVPGARREQPVQVEVSRGLAVGDLDNDGDPDLVVTNNAGPVRLLLNQRKPGDDWLGVRLVTAKVNGKDRDNYGAHAAVLPPSVASSDRRLTWRRAHTDGSFAAASDPRLLFAPVEPGKVSVVVRWPAGPGALSGESERFDDLATGGYVTLRQGTGRRVENDNG